MSGGFRLPQIDMIKGLAIIAVLFLHALPIEALKKSWAALHIWQAVPVFLICTGLVQGLSTIADGKGAVELRRRLYSRNYFVKKGKRILVPLLFIWPVSFAAILLAQKVHPSFEPYLGWLLAIGRLPSGGPGNYYVSILLQLIILLPLIAHFMSRKPALTLLVFFGADLAFELTASLWVDDKVTKYLYSASILRYLAAIGMGFLLAFVVTRRLELNWRRCWPLAGFGFAGSLLYIIYYQLTSNQLPLFLDSWGSQNLVSVFYPGALVLAGIAFLPPRSDVGAVRLLVTLGRASYHIFLVQLIWYRFVVPSYLRKALGEALPIGRDSLLLLVYVVGSVTVCTLVGVAWSTLETRFLHHQECST